LFHDPFQGNKKAVNLDLLTALFALYLVTESAHTARQTGDKIPPEIKIIKAA
jgi:hypothetical protein